ncbi:MAG: bifunctional riboflavin kinase/FAD synthetase [Alphaproteobacteria bacterium]|nr:bifunctional riboflavin kinase/FAD synthetase [Alphaproteobacteria bacterium]
MSRRNMHLIRSLPALSDAMTAIAIGNFDGLHRGHQAVIDTMHAAAAARGLVPGVLTFEPHPRRFFAPASAPFRLLRLADKLAGLRALGVARVAMPRFTRAFADMPAETFLDQVLGRQLGAKIVVTGENFAFGAGRRGDRATLVAWGAAHGVEILTVPPVRIDGEICSSSTIRAAVAAGDVGRAAQWLGHPYRLSGRVVHGAGRGRSIGFPTANILLPPDLLTPAYGVYAVQAHTDNATYAGVANFGIRPTVTVDSVASLEVHLFDTLQEIYGEKLTISLVHKIRDEQKFENLAALTAQIAQDCATARDLLARHAPTS